MPQKSKARKHSMASAVNLYLGWKKQQIIGNAVPSGLDELKKLQPAKLYCGKSLFVSGKRNFFFVDWLLLLSCFSRAQLCATP